MNPGGVGDKQSKILKTMPLTLKLCLGKFRCCLVAFVVILSVLQSRNIPYELANLTASRTPTSSGVHKNLSEKRVNKLARPQSGVKLMPINRPENNSYRPKKIPYPPITSLVNGDHVTGKVDFLLDFVIAGFAKTGTTTLVKRFFFKHPEVAMRPQEVNILTLGEPTAKMVRLLHSLKPGLDYKRGYKAPRDIAERRVLDVFDKYFPRAKLLVGVRHPVEWFHSFYNYKLRQIQGTNKTIAPPEKLDGECVEDIPKGPRREHFEGTLGGMNDRGVCTDLARYHVRLSWLGKTNVSDPAEDALLGPNRRYQLADRAPIRNHIFLYEVRQLENDNQSRLAAFLNDMQQFVGLETPFPVPTKQQQFRYSKDMFNICEDKYMDLRKSLLKIGKNASAWIRTYFLKAPDVTISTPAYFEELLGQWEVDPCKARETR